jgi:hypothetical protein
VCAENQILKEIRSGRYIVCDSAPPIVSSLGAVPKGKDKVRIIHDLSQPGGGINQFALDSSVHYSTIDDALTWIKPGSYLSKIDLSEAYRSIPIHPDNYRLTGLHWIFDGSKEKTYMFDCRLPFGSSMSCKIFQSLSSSIVRMLKARGVMSVSYLDDFIIVADSKDLCQKGLDCLIEIVTGLGLVVNYNKVAYPDQIMSFLGVEINCISRTLALPPDKLSEVKLLLLSWVKKVKSTKRELQSLIGKLNWCARVVRGGRTFTRNLINLLCKVKRSHHYIRITALAKSDILWWIRGLDEFHGSTPFNVDIPLVSHCFATDACLSGGGGHFMGDWFFTSWVVDYSEYNQAHINVLELKTILESIKRWGPSWGSLHIRVRTDNIAAAATINRSTSRSLELLQIVKEIFWLSVRYNFRISAQYLPGKLNILADRISRMSDFNEALCAKNLLCGSENVLFCSGHMTYASYVYLQEMWGRSSRS